MSTYLNCERPLNLQKSIKIRVIGAQFGLDTLIEKVFGRLGDLEEVYLTHDWAEGKTGPFMDLVVVGKVDQSYMYELIGKVEPIVQRKIRVAVYQSVLNCRNGMIFLRLN